MKNDKDVKRIRSIFKKIREDLKKTQKPSSSEEAYAQMDRMRQTNNFVSVIKPVTYVICNDTVTSESKSLN